jgi:hypothetical protein
MPRNSDPPASSQEKASDLHTSLGEVVWCVDLDQAACSPGRLVPADPSL